MSSLNRKPGCSVANVYDIKPGPSVIVTFSSFWDRNEDDVGHDSLKHAYGICAESKMHEDASSINCIVCFISLY